MLDIQLTEKQQKIWSDTGDNLAATPDIRHLALQYYIQYRESLIKNQISVEEQSKINNLITIAYFISQKSQIVYNVKGEKIAGVAFAINQIIKSNTDFQDLIFHMKEMLKIITIKNKEVQSHIEEILKKFKFTMTFHHKFVSTFNKIKPRLNSSNIQFQRSLLWLIFILIKQKIENNQDIINTTCLMASVFIFYVEQLIKINCRNYQLEDSNYGGLLKKQTTVHVFLEFFRIKDMSKFSEINKYFLDKIDSLKNYLKINYFFEEQLIEQVYKKADCFYMKKLSDEIIDQRLFLKQRINTIFNAKRFTPFGGKNYAYKTKANNHILSHRILNYQKDEESHVLQQTNTDLKTRNEKSGSILLKRLIQNKTPSQKTPLIRATPMTDNMEMYNWILEKSNYHKFDLNQLSVYIKAQQKTLKLINGLYKDVCFNEKQRNVALEQRQKLAILMISASICFFVTNSGETIQNFVEFIDVNWFDIWSKIDCFFKYDTMMPNSIKIHLLSLETSLISKSLWKTEQIYLRIFQKSNIRSEKQQYDRLYRRMLHQIVYQIFFICQKLKIGEKEMNSVFLLCQFVLIQCPIILLYRNLYHLILCSIFAISKALDLDKSFYSILNVFKDTNSFDKNQYFELVQQIYCEGKQNIDIIKFYNEQFRIKAKAFMMQIKYSKNEDITLARKDLISSPVKDLLPVNVIRYGEHYNKSSAQTPFSITFQAYHESPLLKERKIKNIANYVDGKKILQKKTEFSKQQNLRHTSNLINQKWSKTRSPERKSHIHMKKQNQNC